MKRHSLLIEFLSEELPPLNLEDNIGTAFSESVYSQLKSFLSSESKLATILTPRRFGCLIEGLNYANPDVRQLRKGPAIDAGLKDGHPTPALLGFANSCKIDWQSLEKRDDGYFYSDSLIKGVSLPEIIQEVINNALKKIQINKTMRWGSNDYSFVRPVHNLVVMIDDKVIDCEAVGLSSTITTLGHRFMSKNPVKVATAKDYFEQIKTEGKVIASFKTRYSLIEQQLADNAQKLGLKIAQIDGLLDEVTALTEWPEVLIGAFNEKFLNVPQECLILSMAKNQKYFALVDNLGKLSNKFLFVANLLSEKPQVVIDGNQKVLAARLADAEFFYHFDQRTKLSDFVPRLGNVVYHNKLGSQLARISRLQKIAALIAPKIGVDPKIAVQTAYLLKADLVTEMVGEFPELQGIMGKYYALSSGENDSVANAIEKHYYPRFSGDSLPDTQLAILMSLTDKLESLVGIWGIGLIPSGDKDPYGLRRSALGIIRILLRVKLDIKELLELTSAVFKETNNIEFAAEAVSQIYHFILQRLANYLTSIEGYSANIVNSALKSQTLEYSSHKAKEFCYLPSLLAVLVSFAADDKNQPLFQANKRIENILKKNSEELSSATIQEDLFTEDAERTLYQKHKEELSDTHIKKWQQEQDWSSYFAALSRFNEPLDHFFSVVMVMSDNLAVRQNRLLLLKKLHESFNVLAKLTELT